MLLAMYDTAICQSERCQRVRPLRTGWARRHTTLGGGGAASALRVNVGVPGSRLPTANSLGASLCT